jgi:hypothetical protein
MLPDFLKARGVIKKKQHTFLAEAIRSHTPSYLRQASVKTIYEGDSLSVQYEDGQRYEKPLSTLSVESGPGTITDLKANPNMVYQHLNEMAQQFVEQQLAVMIKTLTDVAHMAGNVVQREDFTIESIFEILEKYPVDFDETGQSQFPTIFVGQDRIEQVAKLLLEIQNDPSLKVRHEQLIETKRKQWHDRQNSRELVG